MAFQHHSHTQPLPNGFERNPVVQSSLFSKGTTRFNRIQQLFSHMRWSQIEEYVRQWQTLVGEETVRQ